MKTAQEYKDSLRERKIRVYVKGQLLDSREVIDHPFIRGHVNSAAKPMLWRAIRSTPIS